MHDSLPRRDFVQLCGALLLGGALRAEAADDATTPPPLAIRKIYFLFHPVCWRSHGATAPPAADGALWTACYNRELKVNERQKQFISRMKSDEALVMFPIGRSAAMQELETHATEALGRRCLIVTRPAWSFPPAWEQLADPIDEFLNNPDLAGKDKFLEPVPAEIQQELAAELRDAWETQHRPRWNIGMLKVAYFSRMCAFDIRREFAERKLQVDPVTVESEAFGEGFEQCAMTWKQMLVPYLGFARPPENTFDLSVSGAPFLVEATLRERISLPNDLRLYLWKATDGRHVGMFARPWCRMKDPLLFVEVSPAGMTLEVRETHNRQFWPKPDAPVLALTENEGRLRIPVFNGIRRDFHWTAAVGTPEEPCYLIADGIPFEAFRTRLVDAAITP